MTAVELKNAIDAANLTLAELGEATGIHYTTLSRATNGLALSAEQERRVQVALRAALKRAESAAARERAKLMPAKREAVTAEAPTAA
jgi:transcriptional regulator with XRE-family HTH domain